MIAGVVRSPAVDVDGLTIEIEYTCHGCRTTATLPVPARDPAADVCSWVDVVMHYVAASHRRHAPKCGCKLVDLKIPVAKDGDPLGTPRRH